MSDHQRNCCLGPWLLLGHETVLRVTRNYAALILLLLPDLVCVPPLDISVMPESLPYSSQ
jgi:hypothetical protein